MSRTLNSRNYVPNLIGGMVGLSCPCPVVLSEFSARVHLTKNNRFISSSRSERDGEGESGSTRTYTAHTEHISNGYAGIWCVAGGGFASLL